MKSKFFFATVIMGVFLCNISCASSSNLPLDSKYPPEFIRGFDVSCVKQIEDNGGVYKSTDNTTQDIFEILKKNGINWIRVRLWNNPTIAEGNNNSATTLSLLQRAKQSGFKILLDFHYSDYWADPGKQIIPKEWEEITDINQLSTEVYNFTKNFLILCKTNECLPDVVQIGNEIDNGIMLTKNDGTPANLPLYTWTEKYQELKNLNFVLTSARNAVKEVSQQIKVAVHISCGGIKENTDWIIRNISGVNFDCIGLSWYPFYNHGTLKQLEENINYLRSTYKKEVFVAENSFAWTTTEYGDSTPNLFYTEQIQESNKKFGSTKLNTTPQDQSKEIELVKDAVYKSKGLGMFYWGGEWISTKTFQSNWENQALFDIGGKELEGLKTLGN